MAVVLLKAIVISSKINGPRTQRIVLVDMDINSSLDCRRILHVFSVLFCMLLIQYKYSVVPL